LSSFCSRKQQLEDALLDDLVEGGRDLVADDELGIGGERAGDADALLLAAGQFARQPVDEAVVELDQVEQLADAAVLRIALQPEIELERPADDVAHRVARVHGGVGHLVDHLDAAQRVAVALLQRRRQNRAVEHDLAGERRQEAGDDPRQRGFARARLAHHRHGAPARQVDGHVVEDFHGVAVGGIDALDLEDDVVGRFLGLFQFAHRPQGFRIVLGGRVEHVARRRFLHRLAIAQHHDAVGHLGHDGEIVGDVEGGGVELSTMLRIAASTSTCVVTSRAVVGSSKMMRSGRQIIAMAVMARCSWPPETWWG
jgi:hypothetical protein